MSRFDDAEPEAPPFTVCSVGPALHPLRTGTTDELAAWLLEPPPEPNPWRGIFGEE
jgi:hypothetical protein